MLYPVDTMAALAEEGVPSDVLDVLKTPIDAKKLLAAKILNKDESGVLQDFIGESEAERQTFLEEVPRQSPR